MARRFIDEDDKASSFDYCILQVMTKRTKGVPGIPLFRQNVIVDTHCDTLSFVEGNLDEIMANVVRTKRMEARAAPRPSGSLPCFDSGLARVVTHCSVHRQVNILEKLSRSLKKALILMAMDRYAGNTDAICQVFGINEDTLESEKLQCGL